MMLQRSAAALARRAAFQSMARRTFTTSAIQRDAHGHDAHAAPVKRSDKPNIEKRIEDIVDGEDLLPPGAPRGTVPTDFEQSTGLERLEIIGKMQGIDIFDMKPLPSDRVGTIKDPIMVKSFGEEQFLGCTGCPADSHHVRWMTITRDRPLGRCTECGSCYMMEYVGPPHVHPAERYIEKPKDFSDFIKPEYIYK